jgi:hypothetical protein
MAVFDKLVAFQDWVTAAISAAITAALTNYYTTSQVYTKTEVDNRVLQTVSTQTGALATGTTVIPTDNTIPQSGEGDQYMSLAITPLSATSKLHITVTWIGTSSAITNLIVALFRDATANALAAGWLTIPTANYTGTCSFTHVVTSGSTSATTFKVRAGGGAASTTTFNGSASTAFFGGVLASSIVIREVLP